MLTDPHASHKYLAFRSITSLGTNFLEISLPHTSANALGVE